MDNELKVKIQERLIENLAKAIQDLTRDMDLFEDRAAYQAMAELDKAKMAKEYFEGRAKLYEFSTAHDAISFALPLEQSTHEFLQMGNKWFVFTRPVPYQQLTMFTEQRT